MHLIAGLGNPGEKYARNRHNVGFMAIDAIAGHFRLPPFRAKFNALITDGSIEGRRVLLVKPQTFMNKSGDALAQVTHFYKLGPQSVSVIYDELDLPPGKVRIKQGGGHGGHNGLRSIDPAIGVDYLRVRIGIGHPGHKDLVTPYVLGDFAKADTAWLAPLLDTLGAHAGLLASANPTELMNRLSLAAQKAANGDNPPSGTTASVQPAKARADRPVSENGPMAAMLKKLLNKDKS